MDTVFLKGDGVLWRNGTALPGAPEALSALRRGGKRLFFLTNSSTRTRAELCALFRRNGIDVSADELVPSSCAVAEHLEARGVRSAFVLAGDGLRHELAARGIALRSTAPDLELTSETDFYALSQHAQENPVDAVVCGFSYQWNFAVLSYMSLLLQHHQRCELVATSGDVSAPFRTAPDPVGAARRPSLHLGGMPSSLHLPGSTGPLAMLECTSGKRAVVLGKPSASLAEHMKRQYDVELARACVVGDRLESDIAFARNTGMTSVLVLTGDTAPRHIGLDLKPDGEIQENMPGVLASPVFASQAPDFILPSFGSLGMSMSISNAL